MRLSRFIDRDSETNYNSFNFKKIYMKIENMKPRPCSVHTSNKPSSLKVKLHLLDSTVSDAMVLLSTPLSSDNPTLKPIPRERSSKHDPNQQRKSREMALANKQQLPMWSINFSSNVISTGTGISVTPSNQDVLSPMRFFGGPIKTANSNQRRRRLMVLGKENTSMRMSNYQ